MNKLLFLCFSLISIYSWGQNEFITTWKTDNPGTSNSTSITIPVYSTTFNYDVDWDNDGTFDQFGLSGGVTHDFGTPGIYTIAIRGQFTSIYFNFTGDRLKLLDINQWGNVPWAIMFNSFNGCDNLICSATDAPNLTNLTNMTGAFYNTSIFNGDFSNWDVSNVTNMSYTFGNANSFNSDLSNWDVSNVTNMTGMFWEASSFNSDLTNWDVGNVASMSRMFHNATSFNGDVSNWNIVGTTDMSRMFEGATSFDQNLGVWDVVSIMNMTDMFLNTSLSTPNYDSLLIGWSSQVLTPGVNFNAGGSKYCNASSERASIISSYGWTITDAGQICAVTDTNSFITSWKTDNPGTSNSTSITIPTNPAYAYFYDVDWNNDGTFDEFGLTGDITHDFGTAGTYTIAIQGQFESIYFNNGGDKEKILDIQQWGNILWMSMEGAFFGCSNLISTATDQPDLTNVFNMNNMFENAFSFTGDLSSWDVSNVTNTFAMFHNCFVFNSDLSNWNVSNLTDITFMFWEAYNFNSDLSNWNVTNVTNMVSTFDNAYNFNSDIGNWNVSNVSSMSHMFWGASSFDQNLGNWNVSSVIDVTEMFAGCTLSTPNYDSLLIGWSSQVLQPGLNFDGGFSMYSCDAVTARLIIIANNSWTIADAGLNAPCINNGFITTWKTDNPGTSNSTSITIPTNGAYAYSYDVDWDNDGIFDQFGITGDVTHDYGTAGTYTIAIQGQFPSIFFNGVGDRDKILNIDQWGDISWETMSGAFFGCTNLNATAIDVPDLLNVTNLNLIFLNAINFNGDLSNWDVSNITDMSGAFLGASNFNSDLSNWNVSSVTTMADMFNLAANFNSDLSNWNVTNVTNMTGMFHGPNSFNSDISNWNVSNVTRMDFMFNGATSFDQNLGNWDMTSVTDVTNMFNGATLSTPNYDSLLIGWSNQSLQPNLNFNGGNSIYCAAASERASIILNFNWSIVDNGGPLPVSFSGLDPNYCLNSSSSLLTGSSNTGFFTGTGIINNGNGTATFDPLIAGPGTFNIFFIDTVNCYSDTMMIVIVEAPPVVTALVASITACDNGIGANFPVSTTNTPSVIWSTTGDGSFDDPTSLNPFYTYGPNDPINTPVELYCISTQGGYCAEDTAILLAHFGDNPLSNPGPDQTVCANNNIVTVTSNPVGITTGNWTTSGSGTFDNSAVLSTNYNPSSADTANGAVTLYFSTTQIGTTCLSETDSLTITFTPSPNANAGFDQTICGDGSSTTISGSIIIATGGIWSSSGTGTFGNASNLNTTYTPSVADITTGFVDLILTSTGNGSCNPDQDAVTISLTPQPSANAGADISTCSKSNTLSGIITNATGGIWSTLGDGVFINSTDLNTSYTIGTSDSINGFTSIILTTTGNGTCAANSDTIIITFSENVNVNVGSDTAICSDQNTISLTATSSTGEGIWSSNGNGTFSSNIDLEIEYQISILDTPNVLLYFTSTNNGNCLESSDSLLISINKFPIVNVGIDTSIFLGESIQLSGSSSSPNFEWSPSDIEKILNPLVSPTENTEYILTSTENGCTASDTVLITVNPKVEEELVIRNLITPNGDGKNDFWTVNIPELLDGCKVQVLNRWGVIVYENTGYNNDWDATLNGELLPDGTYYYLINCDGEEMYDKLSILNSNK